MYKSATPRKLNNDILPGAKIAPIFFCIIFFIFHNITLQAQTGKAIYSKDTKAENRLKLYKNLVSNAINKNLSLALTDSTEENWMDAFGAIELIRYKSPWIESRIAEACKDIFTRSIYFQRSFVEMLYDNFPVYFEGRVKQIFDSTDDPKLLAECAAYLLRSNEKYKKEITAKAGSLFLIDTSNAILKMLLVNTGASPANKIPPLKELLHYPFFEKAKVIFSFQRKNRNYPGIAVIRDSAGNFVKDEYGNIFSVPQLARSMSNMPGYLSNGNTPQGIFRMKGLDTSRSNFIGPTPNIQLTMPWETSLQHFINDSTITDSVWTVSWYRKLLPAGWKDYFPFYEAYYAGKAGRTEIIAHGSTVNPDYYKNLPCYPLTPTLGCLCTKEIWSGEDGRRTESDQQKLVDALQKAGGADGYYIVIELNDEPLPVTINNIIALLQ